MEGREPILSICTCQNDNVLAWKLERRIPIHVEAEGNHPRINSRRFFSLEETIDHSRKTNISKYLTNCSCRDAFFVVCMEYLGDGEMESSKDKAESLRNGR